MSGRNYSLCSTLENMRRFRVCCGQTGSYPETGFAEVWAGVRYWNAPRFRIAISTILRVCQRSPSGFLMTTASVDQQSRIPSFRYKIGTTEREKKR
jgi:hypothetical protein